MQFEVSRKRRVAGYGQRPCFIPVTEWIRSQFVRKIIAQQLDYSVLLSRGGGGEGETVVASYELESTKRPMNLTNFEKNIGAGTSDQ